MSEGDHAAAAFPPTPEALRAEILRQAALRGDGSSICPSEVARHYGEGWRSLMARVRDAACDLAREGRIDILRKGRPIGPEAVRGVIRLRIRDKSRPDGSS